MLKVVEPHIIIHVHVCISYKNSQHLLQQPSLILSAVVHWSCSSLTQMAIAH